MMTLDVDTLARGKLYATLRVTIMFYSAVGAYEEEKATEWAEAELKTAIQRLNRWASWVELEDWEVVGFERE